MQYCNTLQYYVVHHPLTHPLRVCATRISPFFVHSYHSNIFLHISQAETTEKCSSSLKSGSGFQWAFAATMTRYWMQTRHIKKSKFAALQNHLLGMSKLSSWTNFCSLRIQHRPTKTSHLAAGPTKLVGTLAFGVTGTGTALGQFRHWNQASLNIKYWYIIDHIYIIYIYPYIVLMFLAPCGNRLNLFHALIIGTTVQVH